MSESESPDKASQFAQILVGTQADQLIHAVYVNTGQDVVVTTEDKIRICLDKHMSTYRNERSWELPLAVALTLGVALLTATFRDFLGVPKEYWAALFVVSFAVAAFFFFARVVAAIRGYQRRKGITVVDIIIKEIKVVPRDE